MSRARTRTNRCEFCMTDAEKELFEAKLKESGCLTRRAFIMSAIEEIPILTEDILKEVKLLNLHFSEQYRLLKNMSNNLNQVAKICNTYNRIPEEMELKKLDEDLLILRKELMETWASLKQLLQKMGQTSRG